MATLLNRRRYMGGGGGEEPLPQGAIAIEYLESTGNQWIDTGIEPTTTTTWELTFSFSVNNTGQLMGSGFSGNGRFNIGIESSRFRASYGVGWFDILSTHDTSKHTWKLAANGNSCQGSIDGTTTSYSSTFSPSGYNIIICARGGRTVYSGERCKGKLYSSRIWDGGSLILDLIPVRIEQVGYMYDKISKNFYGNSGTDSFTLGPDKT